MALYRYQSRSRRSALSCPSSGLGGREFRRKAYRATRNTRSRIDPARAIIPGIVQPRQRPTQRCSGNICRNDSVKYALASSTELKTRRPSSCRPQYRATHLPSAPQCIAPNIGPSSVTWMDRSRPLLSSTATAFCITSSFWDSSQKRRGLHSAMGRSELQNTRSDVEGASR